jgi:hypothetical protein
MIAAIYGGRPMFLRPRRVEVWLFLAACALPLHGQEAAEDAEDGAVAPMNRWTTQGGCAARRGVTASEPVAGMLETAWEWRPKGEIEGEPLVWDDRIVVAVRTGDASRSLHVLRLADGKPAGIDKTFKTPASPEATSSPARL